MLTGKGGMIAYLDTNDFRDIVNRMNLGDEKARLLHDAFSYQVSKEIAAMAASLKGEVDAILVTGGVAYNETVTNLIKEHIGFLAPVEIFPGEDEMKALAISGLRVVTGKTTAREYTG